MKRVSYPIVYWTIQLKTMACGSRFQSDIVQGKQFLSLLSLTRRENERMHVPWLLFLVIHVNYFFVCYFIYMYHAWYVYHLYTCLQYCISSSFVTCQTLDEFRCLFWCIWQSWAFIVGVIDILNNCLIRD